MRNAAGDNRGWVCGWAVYQERGWHPRIIAIYDTREEAETAAEKAGPDYAVRWGSYDETQHSLVTDTDLEKL